MPSEKDRTQISPIAKYLRYSHAGIQFFVSVAVPTGIGIWADQRLGTGVLFTLLGLSLGFGAGFYSLYREVYSSSGPPGRRQGPVDGDARDRDESAREDPRQG